MTDPKQAKLGHGQSAHGKPDVLRIVTLLALGLATVAGRRLLLGRVPT